jgi:hypothetical protein
MVITSRILQDHLGVDPAIADYFANQRPVPQNNLFWKDKRIYLSAGFGFLTIPFAFDLMYKKGIPLDWLLEEAHVSRMESGYDFLKKYENEVIGFDAFIECCSGLLKDNIKQAHLANDLFALFKNESPKYFEFETCYKALARSDFFLFTLVDLAVTDEWVRSFLPFWYAVARPILLLDDFRDLEEDRKNGEENTIIELGDDRNAVKQAIALCQSDLQQLSLINAPLSEFIGGLMNDAMQYEPVKTMLA